MKPDPIKIVLFSACLAFFLPVSLAQEKSKATATSRVHSGDNQAKTSAPKQLVDLNSAGKAQLKTLPGIGDAEADRIIASRPFRTKAELVTRKLIPEALYPRIKALVVAGNPPMPDLGPAKK